METQLSLFRSLEPLEIPCILQQILKHLPYTDLQKSRLVSTNFNEEACRILRKRSKIVLNSPKRLIAFNLETLWKSLEVNRFCESFQLINVHVATPAMMMFLKKFGSCIKSFELKDSKWSSQELETILTETITNLEEFVIHGAIPKDSPRLFSRPSKTDLLHSDHQTDHQYLAGQSGKPGPIPPKLPKIKQLDLQLYDKGTDEDVLNQFVIDLLSASCNVELIRSRDSGKWRSRRERFQRILFELLINPEVNIKLPKLRRINFPLSPWDDFQIQRLTMKHFPLKYLNLTVLPDISTNALKSLLISVRNSLTKFKLSFTSWRITEFPCDMNLHKLQHLSLDWFNGSMKFVSRLERLQVLILAQVDLNEIFSEEEVAHFTKPRMNLWKFEVYQHAAPVVEPKVVERIYQVFPKVKTLALGKLSDDSLREVFTWYPLLEEFSAIEGSFTDVGVTGIQFAKCLECQNQKHLPKMCQRLYGYERINYQRNFLFSIADLKYLRKLEIKSPQLTNLSVIHGISCLKRLKSLSLWSYELNFRSLKKLVDAFTLEYLETTHSFNHLSEIQYALAGMRGKRFVLNGIVAPTNPTYSLISPEVLHFISQFHDNVCRNFMNEKRGSYLLLDQDVGPSIHVNQHQHQHNLFLIYDACMAEQHALQGLMRIGEAAVNWGNH